MDCGRREPGTARADFLVELRGFEPMANVLGTDKMMAAVAA